MVILFLEFEDHSDELQAYRYGATVESLLPLRNHLREFFGRTEIFDLTDTPPGTFGIRIASQSIPGFIKLNITNLQKLIDAYNQALTFKNESEYKDCSIIITYHPKHVNTN